LYHASLTFLGQWLDVWPMALLPLLYLSRALRAPPGVFPIAAAAGGAVLWVLPLVRRWLFFSLVLALVVVLARATRAARERAARRALLVGAAVMAAAFALWVL